MLTVTGQQFNEILRYPISGPDWFVKIGLQGALLLLLCPLLVGIPLLTGFIAAHTQRGINGSNVYPDWKDWGLYWKLGWKVLAVNFLFYLPFMALLGLYLVMILVPVMLGAAFDSAEVASLGAILGMLVLFVIYPVMFIYLVFYIAIQMATSPKLAAGGTISQAISWKHYIWPYLKANAVSLLIVYLIGYLVSLVAMIGIFALVIGLFMTLPFAMALMGYAHGVVYRLSTVK